MVDMVRIYPRMEVTGRYWVGLRATLACQGNGITEREIGGVAPAFFTLMLFMLFHK